MLESVSVLSAGREKQKIRIKILYTIYIHEYAQLE